MLFFPNSFIIAYSTLPSDQLTGGVRFAYIYPVSGWKDQLVKYNGESFVYDSVGNPTTYRDKTLTWKYGRQLASFDGNTYNYNAEGIRISKTNTNNITTHFYLDGTKILAQDNGNLLRFKYGVDGVVVFTYEGVGEYFYKKNIFGDIIGILNSSGDEIAKYTYDAWGYHKTLVLNNNEYVDILSKISYTTEGSNNKLIAELNPFRYRGYYYDVETGLYYLNSRYYDPEIGRFINADNISILSESMNLINGLNLFAYCNNNPIMHNDESGAAWWDWLWKGLLGALIVVAITAAVVFTAGAAAIALGATIGTTIGIMSGVAVGGLVAGGMSLLGQAVTVGLDNLNFGTLAIDTFSGAIFGGITGGVASIGTLGAQIVGGVSKIALSGLTTSLHGINNGKSASTILKDVGLSMLLSALTQFAIIGGGLLFKSVNFSTGNGNAFTQFIKNSISFIKDHFDFRIFIIKTITGIWDIISGKFN